MPFDYVLHHISYANVILYTSVLPSYREKKGSKENPVKADNPENNDLIRAALRGQIF